MGNAMSGQTLWDRTKDFAKSVADVYTLNLFDFNGKGRGLGGFGMDVYQGTFGGSLYDPRTLKDENKPEQPKVEQTKVESAAGMGAVTGGGMETFDEEAAKKKKLKAKKKGANALQIPMQNTKAPKTTLGLNTGNTTGIQL